MQDCRTHSPGPDQSSPAWSREDLGVQGAPGGSRSNPGPARKPESLLSASYLPVCPPVSGRTEVWDSESQEKTSQLFKAGQGIDLCFVCNSPGIMLTPTAHKWKTNKWKSKVLLLCVLICALNCLGSWPLDFRVLATSTNQYMSWSERRTTNSFMRFYPILCICWKSSNALNVWAPLILQIWCLLLDETIFANLQHPYV